MLHAPAIFILVLATGCSGLAYVSTQDTSQDHWEEGQLLSPKPGEPCQIPEIEVSDSPSPPPEEKSEEEYRTILAGQQLEATIEGGEVRILPFLSSSFQVKETRISLPPRDRREVAAINLGVAAWMPDVGGNTVLPLGAFYYRRHWEEDRRRLRAIVSGVVNFVDFAEGTWNGQGWEALLHLENVTVPVPAAEVIEGKNADFTELEWGLGRGGIGMGWRTPVSPYHEDNDFRVQLFYEPEYFYNKKADKTGADAILPPDTYVHQIHLQLRLDALDRNFVELPHWGFGFGGDVTLGRRDSWSDHRFSPVFTFTREDTRDYLHVTAYAIAATDLPFLSERHRLILSWHGGWTPSRNWDRFSSLRVGGGPPPSETDDLSRPSFPGALFDQLMVERYSLASVEYRMEVEFYLYIHLRGTVMWGKFGLLKLDEMTTVDVGTALSVAITSGFLWNSLIYVEYTFSDDFVRQGDKGHSILISLSKDV